MGQRNMQEIELVTAKYAAKELVMQFRSEFLGTGEKKIHGSRGLHNYDMYQDWLQLVEECEKEENHLIGVQTTTYFGVRKADGKIVGYIELRHTLTEELKVIGGHIGYSVLPTERRKGYAKAMLKLLLDEARQLGIHKVLLTCNIENHASRKTILNCGGILERDEPFTYDKELYYKYWINV